VTPTVTPTDTPLLSGRVGYYSGDRPVPDVELELIGTDPTSTTTDDAGEYGFSEAGSGTQTLQPAKIGDFRNGITALDGSWVLQLVADLRDFTADQRLACDVTGDGTVSALDGTRILQFQADIIQRFQVAELCDSDWVFRPVPDPAPNQSLTQPMIGSGMCTPGSITYDPLEPPISMQNFVALLFGDCTGNWAQPPEE
jgi:hypothetical protein